MDGISPRSDGPQLFEVELLPGRAAYLIRAGSTAGFRRAVQEASSRWGGMCEPIVAVRKGGAVDGWTRQVVELARVDAVVNVDVDDSDAKSASETLGLPLTPLALIDHAGDVAWNSNPASLPALFDSVPVIAARQAPLWQVAAVGDLTDELETQLQDSQIFVRRVWEQDGVGRSELLRNSLIEQSVSRFRENRASPSYGSFPSLIWVAKKNSLRECVFFWNLRAIRPLRFSPSNLLILPDDGVQHWLNFDSQLHSQLARPDEFSPDVFIDSWSVPETQLHAIGQTLGLELSTDAVRTGHRIPAPLRTAPFTYQVNVEPRDYFVSDRRYGEGREIEAIVNRGQVRLRFDSPIQFELPGRTKLRVRTESFSVLPKRSYLATLVHRNASWNHDSIQLLTNAAATYNLELHIPTVDEANHALLTNTVKRHSLSDKGRMAAVLVESDSNGSLRAPGVFPAIRALTTPRAKELLRELEKLNTTGVDSTQMQALAARWGGRGERRIRSARQLASLTNAAALESLSANGWAERGFELLCKKCGLASFVTLDRVGPSATCPACRAVGGFTSASTGPEIFYRLDSFLDKASDQGVVPHVLALEALRTKHSVVALLPGIEVEYHDSRMAEIDLFGIVDGRVWAGEVKSSSREFTELQMSNDVENAVALGADVYLVASTNELTPQQINRATAIAERNRLEVQVMAFTDLQPLS